MEANEIYSALDDFIRHLEMAIEDIKGTKTETECYTIDIRNIIADAKEEREEYGKIADAEQKREIAFLNRQYERDLI